MATPIPTPEQVLRVATSTVALGAPTEIVIGLAGIKVRIQSGIVLPLASIMV